MLHSSPAFLLRMHDCLDARTDRSFCPPLKPALFAAAVSCFFNLAAAAQTPAAVPSPPVTIDVAPPPSPRFPADWYPPDSDVTYTASPDTDAPYTATLVTALRALNPATHQVITSQQNTIQARDSAGRKRDENVSPRPDGHGGIVEAREVSVSDPVSHCSFQWMEPRIAEGRSRATVTCGSRTVHRQAQNISADFFSTKPREQKSFNEVDRFDSLGPLTIDGFSALGLRNTRTRVNATTGKVDQVILDTWYSPELKEVLAMKYVMDLTAHPDRSPPVEIELTNIHRGEPDPALFYPPQGYTIEAKHDPYH